MDQSDITTKKAAARYKSGHHHTVMQLEETRHMINEILDASDMSEEDIVVRLNSIESNTRELFKDTYTEELSAHGVVRRLIPVMPPTNIPIHNQMSILYSMAKRLGFDEAVDLIRPFTQR